MSLLVLDTPDKCILHPSRETVTGSLLPAIYFCTVWRTVTHLKLLPVYQIHWKLIDSFKTTRRNGKPIGFSSLKRPKKIRNSAEPSPLTLNYFQPSLHSAKEGNVIDASLQYSRGCKTETGLQLFIDTNPSVALYRVGPRAEGRLSLGAQVFSSPWPWLQLEES